MVFTNLGIFMVDVNTHVLLRTTDIVWIVLLAALIQKEIPSIWTVFSCILLIAGSIVVSINFTQMKGPGRLSDWIALGVNAASTLASGFMIVLLRRACTVLHAFDPTIGTLEITLFKLTMATIFVFPFTFIELEGWEEYFQAGVQIQLLITAGVLVTAAYQSTVVGLLSFSLATTLGIMAQTRVLPQVILGFLYEWSFHPTLLQLLGTVLCIIGAFSYAYHRFVVFKKTKKDAASAPLLVNAEDPVERERDDRDDRV